MTGRKAREAGIKAGLGRQQLSNRMELLTVYVRRGSIYRIETAPVGISGFENVSADYLFGRE